ncbi:MAG: RNA methyltransferase [Sinobacteraceae bacterium]|nr:RNA methyltransferase [Nevskiaceae bacterium]MCP5360828.1 RNA methyltransferase [Nevskiaceae bacterium]MCP5470989.1 RNA methyltransferase [Nevskiaceae bacterium]
MTFDDLKKLHQKKYRETLGAFLVEGEHLVLELQKAAERDPRLRASQLYVTQEHADWHSPFPLQVIGARQMAQLSETRTPQGLIACVPQLPPPPPQPGERAICLFEIQDPGNLGTILRSLAWFGGFRCLLTPGSVDPYNAKVLRASAGAIFHVPIEIDVPLETLRERYGTLAILDIAGEPLPAPAFHNFDAYLFGNEARGLPCDVLTELKTQAFTIRGHGAIESLNLATAVSLCTWELSRPG